LAPLEKKLGTGSIKAITCPVHIKSRISATVSKSTVYDYFAQWRDDGTWTKMVKALRERTRVEAGHEPTPSAACID